MMFPALKDWRTTVPGLLGGLFGFVAITGNVYHWPQWLIMLSAFAAFGGLASLGINARSQGKHDIEAKQMALAVEGDIKNATGKTTRGAVATAAFQSGK